MRAAFMTALEEHLRVLIRENGPLDVGTFMALAVNHYYATRDPFGTAGDFTTAPEISQMFGEMLGAWAADTWMRLGRPAPFALIECGPGRGTLIADALRVTRKVPGFHAALQVHLIETSPALKEKQNALLREYNPRWHDALDVPIIRSSDHPIILLANEFLDALPVRQIQFSKGHWHERMIGLEGEDFIFGLSPSPCSLRSLSLSPACGGEGSRERGRENEHDIFEFSPARTSFIESVCSLLKKNTGAALFIDYGHDVSACGDTLQAVKHHKFVPVFLEIGEADLTSHVDFGALVNVAKKCGVAVSGPLGQGAFLENLGTRERAAMLSNSATPEQKQDVASALERLTAPAQMGTLFRVMGLCHDKKITLSGF